MKVAFTSCIDAIDDKEQTVWDRIYARSPDVLLLLGDTVYMDYGILNDRQLGWPRKASNETFASTLYERYALQWEVASFRRLVSSGITLGMTWDDHDFAWNNSRGAGTLKKYSVPIEKRLISCALFQQFRQTLLNKSNSYPQIPSMNELLSVADAGIQHTFDVSSVRFIMLDGRSYRQDPNDLPDAEMHGREQRAWMLELLKTWTGLKVVCSGSVMSRSSESWDKYVDYAWLVSQPLQKLIVLTGDIHRNVPPVRHASSLYEITSSGAARPGLGGDTGNFGILDIGQETSVTLFSNLAPEGSRFPMVF